MGERINIKFLLCIAGLLIFVCTIQVYADTQQYGSISIALTEGKQGTSRENVEFSCTKIGEIVDGEYKLKEKFLPLSEEFNAIKSANDMEIIAEKLDVMDIDAERVLLTDKTGKICFSGLTTGVYFLKATNIEKYEQINPFLISIPTFNEEEGEMNYDITVIPKHKTEITTDFPGKPEIPQTGLESPILTYFLGIFVIMAVLLVFNIRSKSTKKKI